MSGESRPARPRASRYRSQHLPDCDRIGPDSRLSLSNDAPASRGWVVDPRSAYHAHCGTSRGDGRTMTTTLTLIELCCPICRNGFTSRAVQSTDSLGGEATDFRARSVGIQPLAYLVHRCERCGYAGTEEQFSEEATLSPGLEGRIWDELAPRLGRTTPTGSEKYEFAAKVAAWQGDGPRRLGDLWLRAAWCAADEDDVEAERYFRRYAVWAYEQALASYDGVDREDRAIVTYLVGELWRRIGDDTRAREWFDKVPSEITSRTRQQWLLLAARQQKEKPQEWFRRAA